LGLNEIDNPLDVARGRPQGSLKRRKQIAWQMTKPAYAASRLFGQ
jgi:hypothetical protein